MAIIRPNDIEFGKLSEYNEFSESVLASVSDLIKVEPQYVQYARAERDGQLLKVNMHPLVQAAHIAYSDHLALVLTPDAIWYAIASATATHINQKSEELRSTFVDHEGKKVISIRRDNFVYGSQSNPWNEVVDDFCSEIGKLTKRGIADQLVADFSTTTKDARVVSQIVLMDAMSKYFEYRFSTMCGIPEVRLRGTRQDWVQVQNKANKIAEIIPEFATRWMPSLSPILQQFIDVFDGKVDKNFWNDIYKVGGGSGGPYLSGWLIALFPYLSEANENRYVLNEDGKTWRDASKGMFAGLGTDDFEYHMNQVPFTWEYYQNEVKMLFVGGLVGVVYDKEANAVQPVFGYAVTEDKAKRDKRQQQQEQDEE